VDEEDRPYPRDGASHLALDSMTAKATSANAASHRASRLLLQENPEWRSFVMRSRRSACRRRPRLAAVGLRRPATVQVQFQVERFVSLT